MKSLSASPQHQQNIVVESREHEESINLAKDLAKLQISMLKLMHASGEIDWDKCTIKNITLGTFAQGFNNVQADRAYGTEISPRSFVISFVILLYAISYNICI